MLVSITPLGSRSGAAGAAATIVDYLEGRRAELPNGKTEPRVPPDAAAYYADSVEGPGRWLGSGAADLELGDTVDADALRALLEGIHPHSGTTLTERRAARTQKEPPRRDLVSPNGPPDEVLTLEQAAALAGVSQRYLHRLAARTQQAIGRSIGALPTFGEAPKPPATYLVASQTGRRWKVTRSEAQRFKAARRQPPVVVAYDVTFSAPKSVSILWAAASATERREIVASIDAAVDAGTRYLEAHAARVQNRRDRDHPLPGLGLAVAAFTHATSRNLDPQLHVHAVTANLTHTPDGRYRALDGRPLFAHAKTAGYLAAAELRHQLARRLGWEWREVHHGLADVDGVPADAIAAMSTRKRDIDSLATELGLASANERQVAAYRTRAAKGAVDPEALRPEWIARLDAVGFDLAARSSCFGRQLGPRAMSSDDIAGLIAFLASARGVTERSAVFDRRDVIQAVAQWGADRLAARQIEDLADDFLTSECVVPIDARRDRRPADIIRIGRRTVTSVAGEPCFSTSGMLAAERQVLDAFQRGRHAGASVVSGEIVESVLASCATVGVDQAIMVRDVCQSGHRMQCVLGPAGTGKTFAIAIARRAWEAAGHRVIGIAVQGTAAESLGRDTGMRAETLAMFLTRLEYRVDAPLDPKTVIVVDEASTAGTRDLARLVARAESSGATIRLIGDPAQHSAVAAGGAFRSLVTRWPSETAELTVQRRQATPDLAEVRRAIREYREGCIDAALARLTLDQRTVEARSAGELLDRLVADWYLDRQLRALEPIRLASSMVAEHHTERRELNARARALLTEDGTLSGPVLSVAGQELQAGDEVICRTGDRSLFPEGRPERYLRNGTRGTIVAVADRRSALVVDFAGRGRIEVPAEFLGRPLRIGATGGLTHAYALTSHAAQGATFETARHLASDASSRAGVYVGLTRGRTDVRLYMVRRRDLDDDRALDAFPRLNDRKTALDSLTEKLVADRGEVLALDIDPDAEAVARALHDVHDASINARVLARAEEHREFVADLAACLHPPPSIVRALGERPAAGPEREVWDRAVSAVTAYRARNVAAADPTSKGAVERLLGACPSRVSRETAEEYRAAATAVSAALMLQRDQPAQVFGRGRVGRGLDL
jgi:conjugative relaxase-like TrwC/TraI family protein